MNSADRLFVRVAGLMVLVALSVVALSSYLPDPKVLPQPEGPRGEPHSIALQLLLCGVVAIRILLNLRRWRPSMTPSAESASYLRLRGLTQREAILAVATVLALLGAVWMVLYLARPPGERPLRDRAPSTSEPGRPDTEPAKTPSDAPVRREPDAPMVILGVARRHRRDGLRAQASRSGRRGGCQCTCPAYRHAAQRDRRAPFIQRTALQCRKCVGHLVDQRLREAKMTTSPSGRILSRQSDLRRNTCTLPSPRHTVGSLLRTARMGEQDRDMSLFGRGGGFDTLQLRNALDKLCRAGGGIAVLGPRSSEPRQLHGRTAQLANRADRLDVADSRHRPSPWGTHPDIEPVPVRPFAPGLGRVRIPAQLLRHGEQCLAVILVEVGDGASGLSETGSAAAASYSAPLAESMRP